jgi:hypothetical protein
MTNSKPKSDPSPAPERTEPATTAGKTGESPKRRAMKLPPGVVPKTAQGSQQRRDWQPGAGGRPQTDFARRAGKSRKVH